MNLPFNLTFDDFDEVKIGQQIDARPGLFLILLAYNPNAEDITIGIHDYFINGPIEFPAFEYVVPTNQPVCFVIPSVEVIIIRAEHIVKLYANRKSIT